MEHTDVEEYRKKPVLSLSPVRGLAAANIKTAQEIQAAV